MQKLTELKPREWSLATQLTLTMTIIVAIVVVSIRLLSMQSESLAFQVVIILIMVGLGVLSFFWVSRSLTRPLKTLINATRRLADGDLREQITVNSHDELGILADALEQMRLELQGVYGDLEQQVIKRIQDMQASEERFRQVVSSLSAHVYMTELVPNQDGINRYISPNIEPLTGYPLEKFTSDWHFWQMLIHPDDQDVAAGQVEVFVRGKNSEVEYRLIRANNEIIWVRDSGRVERDPVTKNLLVYGVVMDINERKKAEQERIRFTNQLRTAAEVTRQINAILDPEELLQEVVTLLQTCFDLYHVHIYLLDKATNELVMRAGSGERGKQLKERGHKISLDYEHSLVARAARGQKTILVSDTATEPYFLPNPLLPETRIELAVPIATGGQLLGVLDVQDSQSHRFGESDIDAFSTLSGQIAIALENARLFAERKQTEEKLIIARDQALEASRFKSDLLANVSHELRTPLNAALGYAEMLQEGSYGPVTEEHQEATTKIIDNSKYLLGIVNQLLDQAKLDSGKLQPKISSFSPSELLRATQSKMHALAQAKGLALNTELSLDVPAMLQGDPVRLQQILVNLVGNAIKFTDHGQVIVNFYLPDATHWAMQVADTGLGIPLEAHSFIFEPFRQLDGSVTREYGGTGLGLSIVKRLTYLMEGEITLESEVGRGSTFTVLLPLVLGDEE